MARDDFNEKTIRALGERVNLHCSNPSCNAPTKGPHSSGDKATSVGVACHIHAASPGGARYDETQTREERESIDNGIWLCATCARLIDADPGTYPATLLRSWRNQAELAAAQGVGKPLAPTLLGPLDRLARLAPSAVARVAYIGLNKTHVHDKFQISVIGIDKDAGVFRFRSLTGRQDGQPPSPIDAFPLSDIEEVWVGGDGISTLRVSGYMDFNVSEPYVYKSRPRGTSPASAVTVRIDGASSVPLSADARDVMMFLTDAYVRDGFPNHRVWNFSFKVGDRNANELAAADLITPFGTRSHDSQGWLLTDDGRDWAMRNRKM